MEKTQIDYKQFEKERIVSLSDLIEEIFRKIWLVVVLAVIFALTFGGYKYRQDRAAVEAATAAQGNDLESSVSSDEMLQVRYVQGLQDQLSWQEEYMDNSVLTQINPYMENQVSIQFVIRTQEANVSGVMSAFDNYVTGGGLAEDLQEKYPEISTNYLTELFSFDRDVNVINSGNAETIEVADNGNVFCVNVVQTDRDSCEALASDVITAVMDFYTASTQTLGNYNVEILDRTFSTVVDQELQTYQAEQSTSLETLRNTLIDCKGELSEAQLQMLNRDSENDMTSTSNESVSISVGISKKYVGVGALAGIVLAVIIIILRYIFRGTVNLGIEFQTMFNLSVFGQVDLHEKKNILVAAWRRLLNKRKNVSLEEQKQLVLENILSYCRQEQLQKILFVGSGEHLQDMPWMAQLMSELKQEGIDSDCAGKFPYSPQAMAKSQEYGAVIFVETLRVSRYDDVMNGVKKCLEQNREIGGVLVLN